MLQKDGVFKITTDAALLGALAWNDFSSFDFQVKILEIGGGTGIISLMLAQRFPEISIHAIDINTDAVNLCNYNFENSKFSFRLQASENDMIKYDIKHHYIIMNPPYFQNDTPSNLSSQNQARHLNGFNYSILIEKLLYLLLPDGSAEIIHPVRYLDEIKESLQNKGGYLERCIQIRHNYNTKVRNCVSRISYKKCETDFSYFNIKDVDNRNSKEYIDLLRPFINV